MIFSLTLALRRLTVASLALAVLGLAACGDGGNGGGGNPPPPPARVTVSGTASFEFPRPQPACDGLSLGSPERRPIRGATVDIVAVSNNAILASTQSDETGFYSVSVTSGQDVFARVRSELRRSGSPSWDVAVRSNTANTAVPLAQRPLYFLDSAPFSLGTIDVRQDLLAATGWDGSRFSGSRAAAPFSVLDVVYRMMQRVVAEGDADAQFPPLDVFWSPDNRTSAGSGNTLANLDSGNIGTSFYIGGSIGSLFLLGEDQVDIDEFDDHVIAHEWGHYFEDRFSRTDSIGGPHTFGDRLDMRLAFGEGFGNAISAIGLDDPQYCDSLWVAGQLRGFGFSLETVTSGLPGWFNEFSISALLYDLWDTDIDGADTLSIGFAPIFEVLTGPQRDGDALTSVFSFFTALKAQPGVDASYIDGLLTAELITGPGIDSFATTEVNDAGARPDVLPVYTNIAPGIPERICVNNQFDATFAGNKLGESRFFVLDLPTDGPVSVTVDAVDPPSQPSPGFDCTASAQDPENSTHSDPDVELWRAGQRVAEGLSCTPNRELVTIPTLSAGRYIIDLFDARHADPATNTPGGFPGQMCFDVLVER